MRRLRGKGSKKEVNEMPGTATVTINGNEWSVNVANTTTELIQGLSGIASLAVGTGMLFVLPARQVVTVQTEQMLFPLDIIFIKDNTVLSIANNILPEYLVEEATPCDMFLEINAGEADEVEVGAIVSTVTIQGPEAGFDFSSIIGFVLPLALLGFVFGILPKSSSHSSNPGKQLGNPKTEAERRETHLAKYGSKELPEKGKGRERVTTTCPICSKEIVVEGYNSTTRSEALRKHIEEKHSHHSIHGEPRRRLVEEYGSWAVGRAEAVCPEDDIACVTREAKRLMETIRGRYGKAEYVTIKEPGATVFHPGDTISIMALERENKRMRELGEKEATYKQ